ncbi:MAG: hypothetical protein IT364_00825 [Candidatus Hydrogenedentes bacterium]|nr:hypothetical protein [Candidatus Hydrogenedentota bacterium]
MAGRRVRESTQTTRKTLAVEYEKRRRLELERAYAGVPTEGRSARIRSVKDTLESYRQGYALNHRPASVASVRSALANVERFMGSGLLPDLTEDRIRRYVTARLNEGTGGAP